MRHESAEWERGLTDAFLHLLKNYGPFTIESAAEMLTMVEQLATMPFPDSFLMFKSMRPRLGAHWSEIPEQLIRAALKPQKDSTPIEEVDFAHALMMIRRIPITLCELAWEKIRKPPPKPPPSLPH